MLYAPSTDELRDLLVKQLSSLFPIDEKEVDQIERFLPCSMMWIEECFSHLSNKYYSIDAGYSRFDPLHGCQWAMLLYRLSREVFTEEDGALPDKIYALIRALSGCDLFYQVRLPDIFTFDHPFGSVIGRADYSNFFVFTQGCTIGNNHGIYPHFGQRVYMLSNSKVIGDCAIGNDVIISANAYVKDADIPSGSIVFGQSPDLIVKTDKLDYVMEYGKNFFKL